MTDETLKRARELLVWHAAVAKSGTSTEPEDQMADTIRGLLAEVERVSALLRWETAGRIHDRASADAAEARLRELASADPVAVVDREAVGRVFWLSIIPDGTLLIRRPEMPPNASHKPPSCGEEN